MTIFMKKFINFAKEQNLYDLLLIVLCISVLFFFFYGKMGSYLVDVGREAYLPWQMNNGEVLYKDLFNVYGPLGYQINALLFKAFGTNLNTLYFAGFVSSIVITSLIYFISKLFVCRKTALSISFVTIAVCVFSSGLFNFIFPYSYNAVYALSGLLASLYALLLYLQDKRKIFLSLSFLFAGFAFANKIEYLPYFCFLFVCLPFFLRKENSFNKDLKDYVLPVVAFGVFPVLSFGTLCLQGATFADFITAAKLITAVVKAPATEYFYNAYGLYAHHLHVLFTTQMFFKILKYALPMFFVLLGLNFFYCKFVKNNFLKIMFNLSTFVVLLLTTNFFYKLICNNYVMTFSWVGLFLCMVLVGFVINLLIKTVQTHKDKSFSLCLTTYDKMFLFLLTSSILVSLKGLTQIVLECYGTFSLAVMIMPLVIFFVHYVSHRFDGYMSLAVSKTVRNFCFITIFLFLVINNDVFLKKINCVVKTSTGLVFVTDAQKSQQKLVNFIKTQTPQDAVLVSVPEGALINFLTQRKGHSLYYYLIPGNVQAFGEENIISDFKKNPPDYFLLNNLSYNFYNVSNFPSFAPQIVDFIEKNYVPIYYVDDDLFFILYKKKPVLR